MRGAKTGSLLLENPHPLAAAAAPIPASRDHGSAIAEEITGLIKLHKNGRVERFPAMPEVPPTYSPDPTVTAVDVTIDPFAGLWARVHVPKHQAHLPVILYFHGGGFCIGSPAWRCYHVFLSRLASSTGCIVISPSYRLAPEHRLPAAYDDGTAALAWLMKQAGRIEPDHVGWAWRARCDFARIFVAGDSAGAAIAYHAAALSKLPPPECVRGLILVQPFFDGEARTASEKISGESMRSPLSLAAANSYWRMALPAGYGRDGIWCNPIGEEGMKKMEISKIPAVLVCAAELDFLCDRNMEFCRTLKRAGKKVEVEMYEGVGHAFQVLQSYYGLSQVRTSELISDVKKFIESV